MKRIGWFFLLMTLVASLNVFAKGNLAKRATRLDTLVIDAAKGFSITNYKIETGQFYRWRIQSDGRDEYKIIAADLFENSWIEQVSINDLEVKPYGLRAVEFDDAGEIDIYFLPVVPGEYAFHVEHLRTQGFSGTFIVE